MFIERSGEERLFRLSLIERVEDIDIAHFGHSGGRRFVRIDGRVLPVVHGLEKAGSGPVNTLRLRAGERELCYPVGSIVEIVQMPTTPNLSCPTGIVAGVSLVTGRAFRGNDAFEPFGSMPS